MPSHFFSLPSVLRSPLLLLTLGVPLLLASLAWQGWQLQQQLGSSPATRLAPNTPSTAGADSNLAPALALFGQTAPVRTATQAPVRLTLLACFVQTDARLSSALVALENAPPRRLRVGDMLAEGMRLERVEQRQVIFQYQGQPVLVGLNNRPPQLIQAVSPEVSN